MALRNVVRPIRSAIRSTSPKGLPRASSRIHPVKFSAIRFMYVSRPNLSVRTTATAFESSVVLAELLTRDCAVATLCCIFAPQLAHIRLGEHPIKCFALVLLIYPGVFAHGCVREGSSDLDKMNIGRYGMNCNEMQSMRRYRRGKGRVQAARVFKAGNEPAGHGNE
jgi:hypothetical protein